jgi:hypothetical protein
VLISEAKKRRKFALFIFEMLAASAATRLCHKQTQKTTQKEKKNYKKKETTNQEAREKLIVVFSFAFSISFSVLAPIYILLQQNISIPVRFNLIFCGQSFLLSIVIMQGRSFLSFHVSRLIFER